MVTANTVVVDVGPDISKESFRRVLEEAQSPAAHEADEMYDAVVSRRVPPAFMLAVFRHESQFGKLGICADYDTKSPGNTRSSRTGKGTVIQVPNRGPFVRYATWRDGADDLAYRLVDPTFVYAKEGRTTIAEIIPRWAPASDNNVPTSYINAVVAHMNRWRENGDVPVAGDDARFQWTPDEHEFGYPTGSRGRNGKPILYLIFHTTEGTDSQAWLRDQHGSSTHYLTDRQFKPRAQHVRDADAAWTAGHGEYNQLGINLELEHKAGQAITPAMYRNAAETAKPILDRHGIPPTYLGRDPLKNKPGEKGIIGHGDVPAPNDHTDPTVPWNWDTFMAALLSLYDTSNGGDMEPREFETGFAVRGRIRDFWERAEAASVAYQGIGLPTSNEYDAVHEGKPVVRQDFERAVLQYDPAAEFPWDVTTLFRTDLPNDVKAQLADVQAKLAEIRQIVAV